MANESDNPPHDDPHAPQLPIIPDAPGANAPTAAELEAVERAELIQHEAELAAQKTPAERTSRAERERAFFGARMSSVGAKRPHARTGNLVCACDDCAEWFAAQGRQVDLINGVEWVGTGWSAVTDEA